MFVAKASSTITLSAPPDGTFGFSDTPPDWNTYPQYTVTYAGDARHVAGTATVMVEFVG